MLVNNAGITRDDLLVRMSPRTGTRSWGSTSPGRSTSARPCAGMMRQRCGRIVNITSVIGAMGNAGQVNYAASKAGLIGLTKSLARELASRNITVNAVAPGFIDTAMTREPGETVRAKPCSSRSRSRASARRRRGRGRRLPRCGAGPPTSRAGAPRQRRHVHLGTTRGRRHGCPEQHGGDRDASVEERVKEIIVEQLGVNAEQVAAEASFIDDLGADSLDTVELVMALEEEFGIEIPDEDAEKLTHRRRRHRVPRRARRREGGRPAARAAAPRRAAGSLLREDAGERACTQWLIGASSSPASGGLAARHGRRGTLWDGARARGESGIGPITQFDASGFDTTHRRRGEGLRPAGAIIDQKEAPQARPLRAVRVGGGRMAIDDAGLDDRRRRRRARRRASSARASAGFEPLEESHDRPADQGARAASPRSSIPEMIVNMAPRLRLDPVRR